MDKDYELLIRRLDRKKILYIEDDADVMKQYGEFFKLLCLDVYTARSAEEGLDLYNKFSPDIIIADIRLPKISGMALVKEIRKADNNTRIIMLTAYTDKDFLLDSIESDITKYLIKPVNGKDIIDGLNKALDEIDKYKKHTKQTKLFENTYYDWNQKIVSNNGENITLKQKELEVLELLLNLHPNVVTYQDIEDKVWAGEEMSQNALRLQIQNLRKKLSKTLIKNVSGVGYQIVLEQ